MMAESTYISSTWDVVGWGASKGRGRGLNYRQHPHTPRASLPLCVTADADRSLLSLRVDGP